MAGSSLFALIDDIATLLDDVATMSKVAVQKTAGVLGDDLALNAHQVSGLDTSRELPVVWAVAKGSIVNKAILVPLALALSSLANWAVMPLLMLGGIYLCYEGVEKLVHRWLHRREEIDSEHSQRLNAVANPQVDMVAFERERIRGAIRTDFVLSAEIIVITLGAVAKSEWLVQVGVLLAISLIMTVGVYGLVGGIVKLDDVGLYLNGRARGTSRALGRFLLWLSPYLLKFLSIAGTVAMFLVGGHIVVEGIVIGGHPVLHDLLHDWIGPLEGVPMGGLLAPLANAALEIGVGLVAGALALTLVLGLKRMWTGSSRPPHDPDHA